MVEPIKPIEGILKDAEGQASVLAKVVRERYWQQQTQDVPPVKAGEEAAMGAEKRRNPTDQKAVSSPNRTYAEFEVNRETREVIVRVIDAESGKLIRTIPPDELVKEIIKGNFQPNQLRRRAIII